jgi:hypothetical protein
MSAVSGRFEQRLGDDVAALVQELREAGLSWRQVCEALAERGVVNAEGAVSWTVGSVRKLAARAPVEVPPVESDPEPEPDPLSEEARLRARIEALELELAGAKRAIREGRKCECGSRLELYCRTCRWKPW